MRNHKHYRLVSINRWRQAGRVDSFLARAIRYVALYNKSTRRTDHISAEMRLPLARLCIRAGPIVRIAPNLCSISDPADLKTVYSGKFNKSARSYDNKHIDGVEHMLILREPRAVKARRGLLLPLFQRANLDAFYPELERYTSVLVKQIEAEQKAQGNVDVFRWLRLVAFDIIGM